ncbi:MAG: hypothetical protein Q8K60_01130 [Parachlamydiaceae bacterium]|nr:hypothetical protein [Parachlamydiaceae bacterium]
MFSNILKIPSDERESLCIKLCQVLKNNTITSYLNELLSNITKLTKEDRDHVITCIRTIFMQKNMRIYPEIYEMVSSLSSLSNEMIKSQTDLYIFFKEMHIFVNVYGMTNKFYYKTIKILTETIPVNKRNAILSQLAPLQGKVGAFTLFGFFLVLSVMSEEEAKSFFESLTIDQWQKILAPLPNGILNSVKDLSDKFEIIKSEQFQDLHLALKRYCR